MICEECKQFQPIGNTAETGKGLCKMNDDYMPCDAKSECLFAPKPYTCKDCDRYKNDFACFTVGADDPVFDEETQTDCSGFIDKKEVELLNIFFEWKMRGINIQEKIDEAFKELNSKER